LFITGWLRWTLSRCVFSLTQVATSDLTRLSNMVRFITSVISGSLKVNNRKRADILADLVSQGFDKLGSGGSTKKVRSPQLK